MGSLRDNHLTYQIKREGQKFELLFCLLIEFAANPLLGPSSVGNGSDAVI